MNPLLPSIYHGSCSCGECKIETFSQPFQTVNCHCSNCRKATGEDFWTISLFWSPVVPFRGPVQYVPTTALSGLVGVKRGSCSKCGQTVWAVGTRAFRGIVLVSRELLHGNNNEKPPCPTANIFYGSGLQRGNTELLTLHSDFTSRLYCVWDYLANGIPQLVGILVQMAWAKITCKPIKRD